MVFSLILVQTVFEISTLYIMNKNNLFIASVALNILLVVLIFVVKNDAASQAKEFVKKSQEQTSYQIGQVNDNIKNNNLLWSLIDSTWKSSDKSIGFVKKLATAQKVPRCGGKDCSGSEDEARLRVNGPSPSAQNPKERILRVGWGGGKSSIKYSFSVIYNDKDKFVSIDVNDLLGRTQESAEAEEEE